MVKPSKKGVKSEAEITAEAKRKKEILDKVAQSNLPTKTILKELGISRSTYYSWLKRYQEEGDEGLLDSRSLSKTDDEGETPAAPTEKAKPKPPEVKAEEKAPLKAPIKPVSEAEPLPTEVKRPLVEPREAVSKPAEPEIAEEKERVMTEEKLTFDEDGKKKRGMGTYALIAIFVLVIGLLFSISSSNYNTYEVVNTGESLILLKGKYAPSGTKVVDNFEPIVIGDMDVSPIAGKKYVGKEAAYKALVAFLMEQVETEENRGDEADRAGINDLLDRAEGMVADAGKNLNGVRLQVAQKRVGVAEQALREEYQKALPIYLEALRMGQGDAAELKAKIAAIEQALKPAAEQVKEAPAPPAAAAPESAEAAPAVESSEAPAETEAPQKPTQHEA